MASENDIPANRTETGQFKAGISGNPSGRPKLPEELKAMKEASLQKAIQILHDRINDDNYIQSLEPNILLKFLEVAFDRFGLPKVAHNELTNEEDRPLVIYLDERDRNL